MTRQLDRYQQIQGFSFGEDENVRKWERVIIDAISIIDGRP